MRSDYTPHRLPDTESLACESTARALGDWLADPEILRPPRVIIPHIAVEGRVTLLSGREKIGKSELLGYAVAAASRGVDVLGTPLLAPVRTIWYAIDEVVADAVRRFERLGADPKNVIINAAPRSFADFHAAVKTDLEAFADVGNIVVDTLSRLMAASGVDPNSSHEVDPVMAGLVDYFHSCNLAAELSYHTGKGGREYRGSTAIGANVDEILTLRRRGQGDDDDFDDDGADDGRRLLVQDGRTLRGRVHLTRINGVYQLYEDAIPTREKITNTLREHGSVTSRSKLAELAGVRKQAGLTAIAEQIGEGIIIESGRMLKLASPYALPGSAPLAQSAAREPDSFARSSQRFPEGGRTAEPTPGTAPLPLTGAGSHTRTPTSTETGTDAPGPILQLSI
jgi:hypothetical protein